MISGSVCKYNEECKSNKCLNGRCCLNNVSNNVPKCESCNENGSCNLCSNNFKYIQKDKSDINSFNCYKDIGDPCKDDSDCISNICSKENKVCLRLPQDDGDSCTFDKECKSRKCLNKICCKDYVRGYQTKCSSCSKGSGWCNNCEGNFKYLAKTPGDYSTKNCYLEYQSNCTDSSECLTGVCSSSKNKCIKSPQNSNSECIYSDECKSGLCIENICKSKLGDSCNNDNDCSTNKCINKVCCKEWVNNNVESCKKDDPLKGYPSKCKKGVFNESTNNKCNKFQKNNGEKCSSDDECESGKCLEYCCNSHVVNNQPKCTKCQSGDGGWCDDSCEAGYKYLKPWNKNKYKNCYKSHGDPCSSESECVTGQCYSLIDTNVDDYRCYAELTSLNRNDKCFNHVECGDNLMCKNTESSGMRCVNITLNLSKDETCYHDSECLSNSCKSNKCEGKNKYGDSCSLDENCETNNCTKPTANDPLKCYFISASRKRNEICTIHKECEGDLLCKQVSDTLSKCINPKLKLNENDNCIHKFECKSNYCEDGRCKNLNKKNGEKCNVSGECKNNNCVLFKGEKESICYFKFDSRKRNESCAVNNECKGELKCRNNKCFKPVTTVNLGDTCYDNYECKSVLCKDGKCKKLSHGDECSSNRNCSTNNCIGSSKIPYRCLYNKETLNIGDTCYDKYECKSNICDNGICSKIKQGDLCNVNENCSTNNCIGSDTIPYRCMYGRSSLNRGDTCVHSFECKNYCSPDTKKCFNPSSNLSVGSTCFDDIECNSKKCRGGTCCHSWVNDNVASCQTSGDYIGNPASCKYSIWGSGNYTCEKRKEKGSLCSSNEECDSNKCRGGTCCAHWVNNNVIQCQTSGDYIGSPNKCKNSTWGSGNWTCEKG